MRGDPGWRAGIQTTGAQENWFLTYFPGHTFSAPHFLNSEHHLGTRTQSSNLFSSLVIFISQVRAFPNVGYNSLMDCKINLEEHDQYF